MLAVARLRSCHDDGADAKYPIIAACPAIVPIMSHRFKKPKAILTRDVPSIPSVSLPTPNGALAEFTEYLAAQFNRTTLFLRNQLFADLIGTIDAAYAIPRKQNQNVTSGRARMYLTCHQAMFSAAACIARGVPLDAAAASRRALEAARTALAIKLDPKNGERWTAYEDRMARWSARDDDQKPPQLKKIKYDVLENDAMAAELLRFIGSLSDGAVHFTPEFFSRLDFQSPNDRKHMFSEYLETDEQEIAHHLKVLAAVHVLILKTLDRCCDHGFTANSAFPVAVDNICAAAMLLYRKYPNPLRPQLEGELAAGISAERRVSSISGSTKS
jgi:hypothetical protein